MTTITIQTSDTYGVKIYRKLKADKNLNKVVIEEATSKEVELILPGKELKDDELVTFLERVSRGKNISINKARKRTTAKIAAWRKTK